MGRNAKGADVAEIIPDRCIGCQICAAECPVSAIAMADGVARIDPEACIGCGRCQEVCPVDAVRLEKKRRGKRVPRVGAGAALPPAGAVAVFIEAAGGVASPVSWELVGKARELAAKRGSQVAGLLLGRDVEPLAREAVAYGCHEVHFIDDPLLDRYLSVTYGHALTDLCKEVGPEILLMGATPLGRDLSGIVATRIQTGLTADCTALDIDGETGLLLMTRPTFGGNIMATIFCERHRPQMSTVRPRVFRLPARDPARRGDLVRHQWTPPREPLPDILAFLPRIPETGSADIARAHALVVAGKGACDPDAFALLQGLADLVGGVVACSRPVVEAGLMPYERQVGQTGKTVAPKLYIGVGVSGAVQHLVGMQGSEKIVAVNADPRAPIFKVADVGLVGDYRTIVPALIRELGKRTGHGRAL